MNLSQAKGSKVEASRIPRRRRNPTTTTRKRLKHAVKWIADSPEPSALKAYLRTAPDGLLKGIVNAALNIQRGGGIRISARNKKLFARYRKQFAFLTSPQVPYSKKRAALRQTSTQTGGAFPIAAIAPIIATALASLGAEFLPKLINKFRGGGGD